MLAWLAEHGGAADYERVTLRAADVLVNRKALIAAAGGELIDGLNQSVEGSAYSFNLAR